MEIGHHLPKLSPHLRVAEPGTLALYWGLNGGGFVVEAERGGHEGEDAKPPHGPGGRRPVLGASPETSCQDASAAVSRGSINDAGVMMMMEMG